MFAPLAAPPPMLLRINLIDDATIILVNEFIKRRLVNVIELLQTLGFPHVSLYNVYIYKALFPRVGNKIARFDDYASRLWLVYNYYFQFNSNKVNEIMS